MLCNTDERQEKGVFMTHVRKQDITVEGEFTYDSMGLELLIDLDDLLRDGGVPRIGKWDANGTFFERTKKHALLFKGMIAGEMSSRVTSHFVPIITVARGHDQGSFAGPGLTVSEHVNTKENLDCTTTNTLFYYTTSPSVLSELLHIYWAFGEKNNLENQENGATVARVDNSGNLRQNASNGS